MAAKVRGITIEIGGDASGLDKALKDVNSSIKSTQSQLKDVNKLLKLDPGNAELIAQKQKLLTKATQETAEKLNVLKKASKEAQEALAKGEIGSEQYDALQREIQSCEIEMRKLAEETDKTNQTLQDSGSSLEQFGDKVSSLGEKTKGISAAAGVAAAGLVGMAVKAAQSADDLNTLSKQTGLSTESLQKMQYAAELIDVPVETINSAIKRMKANLDKSDEAWQKIGVSVKDAGGNYRDIESIFDDTVRALGDIENETERDTAAMDIFGKSADELAGILDDGGQAFRQLGEEAKEKGLIIPQEDLDSANELNDAIDRVKASFMAAFGKAGAQLASALVPVFEALGNVLGKIAGVIANIPAPLLMIFTVLALVVAAVSPLLTSLGTLIALTPMIISGIQAVGAALTSLLANPVVLTIVAIVAALALLSIAIYEVAQNWDKITEGAKAAFDKVKNTISESGIAKHVKRDVDEVVSAYKDAGGGIKGAFSAALSLEKNHLENIFQAMTLTSDEAMDQIEASVKKGFKSAFEEIRKWPDEIREVIMSIPDIVEQAFKDLINRAKTWGKDLAENFTSGLQKMINKVKDTVEKLATAIKNVIGFSEPKEGPLSNFHTYAPDMVDLWCKGINDNLYKVKDMSNTLATAMNPNNSLAQQQAQTNSTLDAINNSIGGINQRTTVNVVLEGDARGIFRVVRQENAKMIQTSGQHVLA